MSIVRGPFTLTWGGNTLEDIESVELEYSVDSEDYLSNAGMTYQIENGVKIAVSLTFLASDLASLAAVLPQYFVAENEQLADGSFALDERGALDVVGLECDSEPIYNDLLIASCGNPAEVFRVLNARTIIDAIEFGKIRKVVVKFIGEPQANSSIVQFLGDLGEADYFMLGDDDLFILGNGENLIL